MRMFAAVALSSAVFLTAGMAAAKDTSAQVTQAPVAPPVVATTSTPNLDEIVCKQTPPTTGSRLGGGRECHTVREWNEREKEAQDQTRLNERMGLATKSSGIAK